VATENISMIGNTIHIYYNMPAPANSINISTKFLVLLQKIPNIGTKYELSALCPGENSVVPTGQKNEWTIHQFTFNIEQKKCVTLPYIKLPFTDGPTCSMSHYNVMSHPDSVTHSGIARTFVWMGGSTNSGEDRGHRERGSGGGSPLVRGSAQFAD
jgi:hypothetical protein